MPDQSAEAAIVSRTAIRAEDISCASARSACPGAFILSHVHLVREGLALSLTGEPGLRVVGTAEPDAAGVRAAAGAGADVVLLDMGGFGGELGSGFGSLAAARALAAAAPAIKVVAFAVTEIDTEILACAESGMAGYVSRDGTVRDLVDAVQHALRGELHCSPRIAAMLFGRAALARREEAPDELAALTFRECEVGRLIERGLSNKAIATELRVSAATVKNQVHSILAKLKVGRRGEVAARLRRQIFYAQGTARPEAPATKPF